MYDYAVLDVETTGLSRLDRIIEVAILRLDSTGEPLDSYVTLINPKRDVSLGRIHGITASDVAAAPVFEEIAGDIVSMLRGAVVVAHNSSFDLRMIASEFDRLSAPIPLTPSVCTVRLAQHLLPGSTRLGAIKEFYGIDDFDEHAALGDVLATREIFVRMVSELGGWSSSNYLKFVRDQDALNGASWPTLPKSNIQMTRSQAYSRKQERDSWYIARLIDSMPMESEKNPEFDEYLSILDRVLEDRLVEDWETEALFDLATKYHLSREQVEKAHKIYFGELSVIAWADGTVTEIEKGDLEHVANILCISSTDRDQIIANAKSDFASGEDMSSHLHDGCEFQGMSICFTGAMICTRDGNPITRAMAQEAADQAGMVVHQRVTKKTDLLVVADPETLSGKARKAHDYGTRIIAETVFWNKLGMNTD